MFKSRYEKFEHEFNFTNKDDVSIITDFLKEIVEEKNNKRNVTIEFNKDSKYYDILQNVPSCKIICPTYYFGAIRFSIITTEDKVILQTMYCNIIKAQIKLFFY